MIVYWPTLSVRLPINTVIGSNRMSALPLKADSNANSELSARAKSGQTRILDMRYSLIQVQRCGINLISSKHINSFGLPYKDCVNRCGKKRVLRFIVAVFVCILGGLSVSASAETCPGNPDALGTSRVLTINPGDFTLVCTENLIRVDEVAESPKLAQ